MFVADSLKKSKQRFGEFEFKYFGGSDVANKLNVVCEHWTSGFMYIKNCRLFINKPAYYFVMSKSVLCKVHIFWEGHKILRNLHLTFVLCSASQN